MKVASYAASIVHKINSIVVFISLASLLIMVFFVAADVIGRYLFDRPIVGGLEIQELMMVVIVFLAFGVATRNKQHVYVELLVQRFKGRALAIANTTVSFLSFGFTALVAWQTAKSGLSELTSPTGDFTPILRIPVGPFILVAALGLALMSAEFLINSAADLTSYFVAKSPVVKEVTPSG